MLRPAYERSAVACRTACCYDADGKISLCAVWTISCTLTRTVRLRRSYFKFSAQLLTCLRKTGRHTRYGYRQFAYKKTIIYFIT